MRRARWKRYCFGMADERYGLILGDRLLGGIIRKRHGEAWRAYIVTSTDEPAVMARGHRDAGDGRFHTRGPAKHAVERAVRAMLGGAS